MKGYKCMCQYLGTLREGEPLPLILIHTHLFVTGLNIVGCCSSIDAKKSTRALLSLGGALAPLADDVLGFVSGFGDNAFAEQ